MRRGLKEINNIRKTFTATFKRYGTKTNWHGFSEPTILLVDVKDSTGRKVTSHLWFHMTAGFKKLGELKEGTSIQFDARVKPYNKGYRKDVFDYKLNNPTKIKILNNICLEVLER